MLQCEHPLSVSLTIFFSRPSGTEYACMPRCHILSIITNCAQTLHAPRVLRCHGLPGDAVQTVYRAAVGTKLLYGCCAWSGFITASDRKRVDALLRRSKRCGFCPPDLPPFNDLIEAQEDQLFSTINHNPSIYFTTSYHHPQLLHKATTSGTDISWTITLFREWYLKTCTERYAISISLSGYLSLNLCSRLTGLSPLYTTVILM